MKSSPYMTRMHFFIFSLYWFVCGEIYSQDIPLSEQFVFTENSKLEHNGRRHKTYDIVSGNMLVFEFISNNAGDEGNASTGLTKLSFQVADTLRSFEFTGPSLKDTDAIYVQFCLCPDEGISEIVDGTIKGQKHESGNWWIDLSVSAIGRKTDKVYRFSLNELYSPK